MNPVAAGINSSTDSKYLGRRTEESGEEGVCLCVWDGSTHDNAGFFLLKLHKQEMSRAFLPRKRGRMRLP